MNPAATLVASAAILAGVFGSAPAIAHTGTGAAVAADYEARLGGIRPATPAVRVRALDGDVKLSLRVAPGHAVVVLGVVGEPFLRFADDAVYANLRSPTAAEIRLVQLQPGAAGQPRWLRLRGGRGYAWHESRLRPVRSQRSGRVSPISISLRIDGRPARVVGSSWHAAAPPVWPWIVLGLAPAIVVVALRRRIARLVVPVSLLAIAATLLCLAGRTLEPPYGLAGAAAQIGIAAAVAAAGLTAIVRARGLTRSLIAAGAGALAALYAASSLAVLFHGFVLSRLPASVDRGGTVLGLGCGICLVGMLVAAVPGATCPSPSSGR